MSKPLKSTAAVLAGAVALALGAYAVGTAADSGSAVAEDSTSTTARAGGPPPFGPRGGPGGPNLDALATKLGVSAATLRSALEALRPDRSGKRERIAAALAAELNLPVAKVTEALEKLRPDRRGRPDGPPPGLVTALARELSLDADKVRAALEKVRPGPGTDRGQFLSMLARELGVEQARLAAALREARRDGPRRGWRRGAPVTALAKELGVAPATLRAAFEKVHAQKRAEFAAALAKRLNLDEAKVSDALDSLPRPGRRP